MKKKLDYIEENRLFRSLLNLAYSERDAIGKELHAKKAYLNELQIIFGKIERSESLTIDSKMIDELKQIIHQFQDALKEIRTTLYPPLLNLGGIFVAIKQYIVDYQKSHPVNVDLEFNPDDRESFGQIKDIRIYKTCIEIIDFVFIRKANSLRIKVNCDNNYLYFELLARSRSNKQLAINNSDRIELAKSYMMWANGIVREDTDWINKIAIKFPL